MKEKSNSLLSWIAGTAVFLLLAVFLVREIACFDVWFHLKAGEWMAVNHKIPYKDIFSYTAAGYDWIDSHWLFQILIYLMYKLGGFTGLQVFTLLVFVLAFSVIFAVVKKEVLPYCLMIAVGTILLVQERFYIRPEMITILFIGVYFTVIELYRQGRKDLIYALPVLQLIWTNMHGLFILGPVIIACFIAGGYVSRISGTKVLATEGGRDKKLMITLAAVIAACFINPYGLKGTMYPFLLFTEIGETASDWMKTVEELQPSFSVGTDSITGVLYRVMIAGTALTFLGRLKKINFSRLLVYAGFLYISFKARRNISLFAFISLPVAAANLGDVSEKIKNFLTIKKPKLNTGLKNALNVITVLVCACLIVSVVTDSYYIRENDVKRFGFGLSRELYPEDAVKFIDANKLSGNLLNANSIGGYLAWKYGEKKKVHVDGRWEVYGKEFTDAYKHALTDMSTFSDYLNRYDINYVLFTHISMESRRLLPGLYASKKWALVYYDNVSEIFIENTPENAAIITKYRVNASSVAVQVPAYPVRKGFQYNSFMKGSFFYALAGYLNAEYEFGRAIEIYPGYQEAYNNLGNVYFQTGEYAKAEKNYRKALGLNPKDVKVYKNLESLYMKTENTAELLKITGKLTMVQPGNPENHYELALANERLGNKEEFIKELETAIKLDPGHFNAHYKLAQAYSDTDVNRTIIELREVIRINPDFARAYYNLGLAYLKKEQYEKTYLYWKIYKDMEPEDPNLSNIRKWLDEHD